MHWVASNSLVLFESAVTNEYGSTSIQPARRAGAAARFVRSKLLRTCRGTTAVNFYEQFTIPLFEIYGWSYPMMEGFTAAGAGCPGRTQMTRKWRLRQLFVNAWGGANERETAEQSGSFVGMIESGDFKIDLDERAVTLHGHELQLTQEEFDVLVFLASHPQSLVTPRTMLTAGWTGNRLGQAEFLRALISLRKKLEAVDPGNHYLRTEPWIVYRFDPTSSPA